MSKNKKIVIGVIILLLVAATMVFSGGELFQGKLRLMNVSNTSPHKIINKIPVKKNIKKVTPVALNTSLTSAATDEASNNISFSPLSSVSQANTAPSTAPRLSNLHSLNAASCPDSLATLYSTRNSTNSEYVEFKKYMESLVDLNMNRETLPCSYKLVYRGDDTDGGMCMLKNIYYNHDQYNEHRLNLDCEDIETPHNSVTIQFISKGDQLPYLMRVYDTGVGTYNEHKLDFFAANIQRKI